MLLSPPSALRRENPTINEPIPQCPDRLPYQYANQWPMMKQQNKWIEPIYQLFLHQLNSTVNAATSPLK
jgi:hypothetical protein